MKEQKIVSYEPVEGMRGAEAIRKKELVHSWNVVNLDDGYTMIEVRTYMGRAASSSSVYALVWIRGEPWGSGSGQAGGYGYHKASAAISGALSSAGVVLEQSIHGVGDSAILEALHAFASFLGIKRHQIIESYP